MQYAKLRTGGKQSTFYFGKLGADAFSPGYDYNVQTAADGIGIEPVSFPELPAYPVPRYGMSQLGRDCEPGPVSAQTVFHAVHGHIRRYSAFTL